MTDDEVKQLEALKEKEIMEKYKVAFNELAPSFADPEKGIGPFDFFKAGFLAQEKGQDPSGNQYTGYLKEGNQTLTKVHKDEPIFVLRAQDNTAPSIIMNWIGKNLDTVDEAKLKEAFQTVLAMRRYSFRRDPT